MSDETQIVYDSVYRLAGAKALYEAIIEHLAWATPCPGCRGKKTVNLAPRGKPVNLVTCGTCSGNGRISVNTARFKLGKLKGA